MTHEERISGRNPRTYDPRYPNTAPERDDEAKRIEASQRDDAAWFADMTTDQKMDALRRRLFDLENRGVSKLSQNEISQALEASPMMADFRAHMEKWGSK